MSDEIIQTGRWAVGLDRKSGATLMRFEFTDAPPLTLLIPRENAAAIAQAILDHNKNEPPRLS